MSAHEHSKASDDDSLGYVSEGALRLFPFDTRARSLQQASSTVIQPRETACECARARERPANVARGRPANVLWDSWRAARERAVRKILPGTARDAVVGKSVDGGRTWRQTGKILRCDITAKNATVEVSEARSVLREA